MNLHRRVAITALAAGLAIAGSAMAQPAKAQLGQHLLQSTFADRLEAPESERSDPDLWHPWSWADIAPIGEVRFPHLDETRIVVDSSSGEALAWAVGHVRETAALGAPGVSMIAGHRDGTFSLLSDVAEGNLVVITTLDGNELRYVVESRVVVDSDHFELPIELHGKDELVLATCWPIDTLVSGSERLLIRARLIG